MAYVRIVPESQASGELAGLYRRFGNPDGTVDNVLKVHSANPESLAAHCALYVQSMHRPGPVSRAEREIVGVAVSRLNGCTYCLEHHAAGLARLLPGERKSLAATLKDGDASGLTERERAMVEYAEKLTRDPAGVAQRDVEALRSAGLTDREIVDVAQAAAYFAYANRIVLGLGAELGTGEGVTGAWPEESRPSG
ncbi:MAG: peroxidase-related enzyme [Planctomycetota bacterium]